METSFYILKVLNLGPRTVIATKQGSVILIRLRIFT